MEERKVLNYMHTLVTCTALTADSRFAFRFFAFAINAAARAADASDSDMFSEL